MSNPLTRIDPVIPAKVNLPLAKSTTFLNLALVGISNGSYSGGAGYVMKITGANAPYIAFAVGVFASGTGGTNGAYTQTSVPGIYTPVVTGSVDGAISANILTGAAKLLPDGTAPAGSTVCSVATFGQKVYTTDGQSGLCFLGPTGPAAALTAGYVLAGTQLEFDIDGDGQVIVMTQPWLNSVPATSVTGIIAVVASAASIALTGAKIGDTVILATDLTTVGDVRAAFETTISVDGHIAQTSNSGSNGVTTADKVQIMLQRGTL